MADLWRINVTLHHSLKLNLADIRGKIITFVDDSDHFDHLRDGWVQPYSQWNRDIELCL